jgi:hypothetical protein
MSLNPRSVLRVITVSPGPFISATRPRPCKTRSTLPCTSPAFFLPHHAASVGACGRPLCVAARCSEGPQQSVPLVVAGRARLVSSSHCYACDGTGGWMLPAAATSLSLLQLLCSLLRKQWPASPDSDAFNDLSRSTLLYITSCASLSLH